MTFNNLVELKKTVNAVIDNLLPDSAVYDMSNIINNLNNFDIVNVEQVHSIVSSSCDDMLSKNRFIRQQLENLLTEIDHAMTSKGLELLKDSSYFKDTDERPIISHNVTDPVVENHIKARINNYANWQYPALIVHSFSETNRIDYLTDADPLYIGGPILPFIKEQVSKYPSLYQNRLRIYQIIREDFSILPQAQFGFVFCWEYFNQLSIDRVEAYLVNILKLLRPGGAVMFSYTNAELSHTASLVDDRYCAWATKSYMRELLTRLGYIDLIFTDVTNKETGAELSWVEARKTGKLSTPKKAQVLGSIHEK